MFFIQMVLNQLNRRNKVYTMYIHTCTQGCHCKLLTGSHWPPDVWKVCGRLLPGLVLVPSEYYSVAVYVLDQCCSRVLRVCVYTYQVLHTRSVHKRYIHSRQRQQCCVCCMLCTTRAAHTFFMYTNTNAEFFYFYFHRYRVYCTPGNMCGVYTCVLHHFTRLITVHVIYVYMYVCM